MTEPLTGKGTIVGTFQYMAPEQLEGKELDAKTDIFAFGAVLYEMATGERAFEGDSRASLIASIMSSQPRAISELQPMTPPALDHLVRMCLAKDPDDRIQTAHDVKLQLQWITDGGSQAGAPAPYSKQTVQRNLYRIPLPYHCSVWANSEISSHRSSIKPVSIAFPFAWVASVGSPHAPDGE